MIHKVVRRSLFFALSLYLFTLANAQTNKEREEFKEMYDDLGDWMIGIICGSIFVGCCLAFCVEEGAGVIIGFIGVMIGIFVPPMILLFISWGYGPYIYPTVNPAYFVKGLGEVPFYSLLVVAIVFGIYIITTDNSGKFRGCPNRGCPKINFTNCFNRCFNRAPKGNATGETTEGKPASSATYRQLRFNII